MQLSASGAAGLQVYHNTCYNNSDYGVGVEYTSSPAQTVMNNIVYANGTGLENIGPGPGTPVITNNLTTDPSFVNAAGLDFHLQSGSAARNAGSCVALVTTDFDAVARPSGGVCDIGAYEYDEGGLPPPTGGGVPTLPRLRLRIR
jgi:hypothetical protein